MQKFTALLLVMVGWWTAGRGQHVEDPCGQFNTCPRTSTDNPECSCDPSCYSFGDCCSDMSLDRVSVSGLTPEMFLCGDEDFYRVAKCPAGTPDGARQLCESEQPENPYNLLLVTDIRTSLIYRNIYCSRCHGIPDNNVSFWDLLVYCPEVDRDASPLNQTSLSNSLYFSQEYRAWGVKDSAKGFKQCYLNLETPRAYLDNALTFPRKCRGGLVSDCPDNWEDADVRQRCRTYSSPLVVNKDRPLLRPYKNFFCAWCNRDSQGYFQMCLVSPPHTAFGGYRGCRGGSNKLTVPPLCVLFDMNTGNGPVVGISHSCPEGEVVFSGTCKKLECVLPGFKLMDGQCVPES